MQLLSGPLEVSDLETGGEVVAHLVRLSAPKQGTFLVSLVIAIFALSCQNPRRKPERVLDCNSCLRCVGRGVCTQRRLGQLSLSE